jgi:host factor-I protein
MARTNNDALQATYLNDLRKQRMTVTMYLVNGMKQMGMIESFDQHAVLLRQGTSTQLIYKHMVASVMPAAKAQQVSVSIPVKPAVMRSEPKQVPVVTRKAPRRTIVREG